MDIVDLFEFFSDFPEHHFDEEGFCICGIHRSEVDEDDIVLSICLADREEESPVTEETEELIKNKKIERGKKFLPKQAKKTKKPEKEIETSPYWKGRIYLQLKTIDLIEIVSKNKHNKDILNKVYDELLYRKTQKAQTLKEEIKKLFQKLRTGNERIYFPLSGIDLNQIVFENKHNKDTLKRVRDELLHRKSKKAQRLKKEVEKLLGLTT